MFCLVFGFSNAATHSWHTPPTWGFLLAGAALLVAFAVWIGRTAHPLLPPRVVLNRNRSGAYVSIFIASLSLFATLLFLTYYLQQTLNYSPIVTGFAFLPVSVCLGGRSQPLHHCPDAESGTPTGGDHRATGRGGSDGLARPTRPAHRLRRRRTRPAHPGRIRSRHGDCTSDHPGTYGVAPQDAGVASATVTVSQQLGASIGTSLLNTIFATAVASYLVTHESSTRFITRAALNNAALAHGYDIAFWWTCAITAGGAAIAAPCCAQAHSPVRRRRPRKEASSRQPNSIHTAAPDRSGHEHRGSRPK